MTFLTHAAESIVSFTRHGEKRNPRASRVYDQRHGIDVLVGVLKASAPVTQASLHASAPGPWALVAVATAAALAILISIALGVRILPETVMLIGP
jgi:hypothetical protein